MQHCLCEGLTLAFVSWPFVGVQEGVQLVLQEGDEIAVTAILDDNWWEGYVRENPTVVGRFPSCCVQVE
jgi:hypothetical protein